MRPEFAKLFLQVAANMTAVADSPYIASIERAADVIHDAFASGHKLLVFGNGGSSADAQHLTAEFVGRFVAERRPLPAIALTTNQAILTAWSNDYSFDDVFARQVEALGTAGDGARAGSAPRHVSHHLRSGRSPARAERLTVSPRFPLLPPSSRSRTSARPRSRRRIARPALRAPGAPGTPSTPPHRRIPAPRRT